MSKDIEYRTAEQVVNDAWSRLITQFATKDTLKQWIASHVAPVAELESQLSLIQSGLNLDAATGDFLDQIGLFLGVPRRGRTDNVYRVILKATMLVRRSFGRPRDLLALVTAVLPATEAYNSLTPAEQTALDTMVQITEYYPADFTITVEGLGLTADDAEVIADLIEDARPAAVDSRLVYSVDQDPLFRFEGPNVTGAENGFGNGKWSGVEQ